MGEPKTLAGVRKLLSHDGFTLDEVIHKRCRVTLPGLQPDGDSNDKVGEVASPEDQMPSVIGKTPPAATQSTIENGSLAFLINEHCMCRKCKRQGMLCLSFSSAVLAATAVYKCSNCKTSIEGPVAKPKLPKHPRGKDKVTDFKANVLFGHTFKTSGDGGTNAQRLMGLLNLPHILSMEKVTFQKLEMALCPV